jgi:hypothetical protein
MHESVQQHTVCRSQGTPTSCMPFPGHPYQLHQAPHSVQRKHHQGSADINSLPAARPETELCCNNCQLSEASYVRGVAVLARVILRLGIVRRHSDSPGLVCKVCQPRLTDR